MQKYIGIKLVSAEPDVISYYADLEHVEEEGYKVVYKDGLLQGIDEAALRTAGEEVCTRVLRNPCDAFHNLV